MDWTGYPSAGDVEPCPKCGDVNGWPCSSCGYKIAGMESAAPRPLIPPAPASETYEAWKIETNMELAEREAAAEQREHYL